MEGRALNWFQWWEEQAPMRTWEEFKLAAKRRFCPGALNNPLGPLLGLKQEGTVMEFREKFELHIAPLNRDERVLLESIFLNGLKEELRAELKMYEYEDLADLMDRALLLEEKNLALSKKNAQVKEKNEWRGSNSKFRPTWGNAGDRKDSVKGSGSSSSEKKEGFRGHRLSAAELEERGKKGLCFKCGELWGRDHVCKFKHMRLMLCEVEGASDEEVQEEEAAAIEVLDMKTMQLSLQSREGLTSNKSFKVWGIIHGRRVLILIDSGATSNFIAPGLVKELGLYLEDTPVYVIEVGSGELVKNKGVCKNLEFMVQGVEFKQHFFLMELGGTEMVLGMDWLASLGNIEANFRNLSLKWTQEGQHHAIVGEPELCTVQASWKAVMKAMQGEGMGFLVEYVGVVEEGTETGKLEDVWEEILAEFDGIFQPPQGLPPPRTHDHAIIMKEGAAIRYT